ncbi:MAG: hypothetical protein L3V56_02535 [Candidatus Magnetoovum sp. WYHC-5]|nr:hypothetical protein [Candidatus Magnetoovum sp. WYHC-5]
MTAYGICAPPTLTVFKLKDKKKKKEKKRKKRKKKKKKEKKEKKRKKKKKKKKKKKEKKEKKDRGVGENPFEKGFFPPLFFQKLLNCMLLINCISF